MKGTIKGKIPLPNQPVQLINDQLFDRWPFLALMHRMNSLNFHQSYFSRTQKSYFFSNIFLIKNMIYTFFVVFEIGFKSSLSQTLSESLFLTEPEYTDPFLFVCLLVFLGFNYSLGAKIRFVEQRITWIRYRRKYFLGKGRLQKSENLIFFGMVNIYLNDLSKAKVFFYLVFWVEHNKYKCIVKQT